MNLVQLVRKARLGVDAIFPSGQVSPLWRDDELVDLIEEANNEINLRLRLAGKKWGVMTIAAIAPGGTALGTMTGAGVDVVTNPITREGETYDPFVELTLAAGQTRTLLPPDFGEVVKIQCVNQTTARFIPAVYESEYWTDLEQSARNIDGTFWQINSAFGQTMYYDVIDARTLVLVPPVPDIMRLQLDYTPMQRPLRYSNSGTIAVQSGLTTVTGVGTTWATDNIFGENAQQRAELLVNIPTINDAVRLDVDYPRIASIDSDTQLTLVQPWAGVNSNVRGIVSMCPTAPRVYHQWVGGLAACFMLRKVSAELSDKQAQAIIGRFDTTVRPSAGRRNTQMSPITDDESIMGGLSDR